MKQSKELTEAVRILSSSKEFGVVTKHLEAYREELISILINTKADLVLAQGMVRSIDQVIKAIVKTK